MAEQRGEPEAQFIEDLLLADLPLLAYCSLGVFTLKFNTRQYPVTVRDVKVVMFLSMTLQEIALFEYKNSVNFRGLETEKRGGPRNAGISGDVHENKSRKKTAN